MDGAATCKVTWYSRSRDTRVIAKRSPPLSSLLIGHSDYAAVIPNSLEEVFL